MYGGSFSIDEGGVSFSGSTTKSGGNGGKKGKDKEIHNRGKETLVGDGILNDLEDVLIIGHSNKSKPILGYPNFDFSNSLSQISIGSNILSSSVEYSTEISTFSNFSSELGTASKIFKTGGTAAGYLGLGVDTYQLATGKMSGYRYSFHAVATGASTWSAAMIGGASGTGVGAAVAMTFMGVEILYDSYNDHTVRYQDINRVHSIGTAIDKAERWNLFSDPKVWMQGLIRGF